MKSLELLSVLCKVIVNYIFMIFIILTNCNVYILLSQYSTHYFINAQRSRRFFEPLGVDCIEQRDKECNGLVMSKMALCQLRGN